MRPRSIYSSHRHETAIVMDARLVFSTPLDTESQQASRDLVELQARRNVLNICGTIVKASAQLLSEAASEQGQSPSRSLSIRPYQRRDEIGREESRKQRALLWAG